MDDHDKTKETLIKELDELRQRVRLLEDILSEYKSVITTHFDPNVQRLKGKDVWRLPGYWH